MEGVGVTFLEKTFLARRTRTRGTGYTRKRPERSSGADPRARHEYQRQHAVPRRSFLDASGYAARPAAFNELIRILDNEVRLITPTDPEGMHSECAKTRAAVNSATN